MTIILDLHSVRILAGPGLAFILAGPALALNIGLCLWPPYQRVPTLITGAHLLLCGLMGVSPVVVAEPGGFLMPSWCGALVVVAYLTAGLRLLDKLMVAVPAWRKST